MMLLPFEDEWFLEFSDGTIGWLTEDNHELALQTRTTSKKIPPLEALTPGKKYTVRKIDFITDRD